MYVAKRPPLTDDSLFTYPDSPMRHTRPVFDGLTEMLTAFSDRLNRLLDSAGCPQRYAGRVTLLATTYSVSPQTARKWLRGEALPNPIILTAIATQYGATTDYLLTGAKPCILSDQLPVPIYSFTGSIDKTHPPFQQIDTCYRPRQSLPGWSSLSEHCAYIVGWADSNDPPLLRSDLLLVDLAAQHIAEDGIYLVRSSTLVSFRRIRQHLDGSVVISRSQAGQVDEVRQSQGNISFNPQCDINAPPSGRQLLILGRLAGILRMADIAMPCAPGHFRD